MDADDRARLRAQADAAFEGPWEVRRALPAHPEWVGLFQAKEVDGHDFAMLIGWQGDEISDEMDFIAAARTGVPALLDHIDQLEAQVQRIRALHEHRAPEPPYVEYCEHCGADWPCATVRVLDGSKKEPSGVRP